MAGCLIHQLNRDDFNELTGWNFIYYAHNKREKESEIIHSKYEFPENRRSKD